MAHPDGVLLGPRRPGPLAAVGLALLAVAVATALVYPLKAVAPVVSLGVVYLLAVLVVSTYVGLRAGLLASLLGAAAFNFFHLSPLHRFHVADEENWVALVAFVIVAAVASQVADVARQRASEAERQRREADLVADLTRLLLATEDWQASLPDAAAAVAAAVGAGEVVIEVPAGERHPGRGAFAIALRDGDEVAGRLVARGDLDDAARRRLRERIVPAVELLVVLARERASVHAEAIETAALRRSDELKTALLRMVSHDLRSPLTAIVTAGHALRSESLAPDERRELADAVVAEGERLAQMVEALLDLSRLQAGAAAPRSAPVALEEVIEAAVERVRDAVELRVAGELPLVQADAAQLERALANVVENAVKHAGGRTVQVRAAAVGGRAVVRVVDQGRGLSKAECARVFDAFHRGANAAGPGSGLGLAIAKGFVEANGGTIAVESVPNLGTSFVVKLPLAAPASAVA